MKDGQLECNDTIPQLKEKYHTGFTVKLKLKQKNLNKNKNNLDQLVIQAEKRGRRTSFVEDFPDSFVMQTYSEELVDDTKKNNKKWEDKESSGDSVDSLDYVKHVLENEYEGELKDEHPVS